MRPFSFVHAADLHIDSPFRGVTTDSSEVAEALYSSTFHAFDALIATTIEREADFLLIAGDIYDGEDRSLRAQLRLRDGLVRLAEAKIQSFLVHGNHDPMNSKVVALDWPKEAHFFGEKIESVLALDANGEPIAAVSGISFPKREESRNLAALFARQESDLFQIGLLHCNVGRDTGHENYAPCSLDDLRSAEMDYWALGHVHTRSILSETPWVVYPGNIQGRSIRETGPRGCYYVQVDEKGGVTAEFVPIDVVRWTELAVSIGGIETVDALEREISESVEQALADAEGRGLVCRVSLTGRGGLHSTLREEGYTAQLLERIREGFAGIIPFTWVQRLDVDSRPEVDLSERMNREDLLGEVLTMAEECCSRSDGLAALKEPALADLWHDSRVIKAQLEKPNDEQIEALVRDVELLCLDLLEGDE